ncbi:MAG: folate-binding protein YgfZ, partial [Candidatus Contendobacter sp.]|nr:folate-binding protein YgfZ [Candidatus Contendobacter sp.]
MNGEWRDFLERAGAHWDGDSVMHFGQPDGESNAALTGDVCCDLSHLGLIIARGPDTERFLQGQLTCDVRQATLEHSLIGAHCNPKGRVLADFRLFRREDAYYLELPQAMVDATLSRLRKYLLRAKAVLEDASDALARIGIAGPNAASWLESALGAVPEMVNGAITADNMTAIRLPGLQPRFELHGAARELGSVWNALTPKFTPVGTESWRLLDILAGIPTIYPETVEAFVPQMINLQQLEGISFQKGCYTGQEIVARTHYLGKLKRRMYLARVDNPTPPRPGDPLFSPQAAASQSAGQLADVCRHPDGGYAVLAVALIECAEQGALRLGDANGSLLQLEALPYRFDGAA